uniref:Uncharacterized protein n=1 Tax=Macaca fascicularis TaxID=9541 RepID=Q8HXG0_MACFA|nr:hypothetical protein [Macaca fascicularis]
MLNLQEFQDEDQFLQSQKLIIATNGRENNVMIIAWTLVPDYLGSHRSGHHNFLIIAKLCNCQIVLQTHNIKSSFQESEPCFQESLLPLTWNRVTRYVQYMASILIWSLLVYQGCHNKTPQSGRLNKQKSIV